MGFFRKGSDVGIWVKMKVCVDLQTSEVRLCIKELGKRHRRQNKSTISVIQRRGTVFWFHVWWKSWGEEALTMVGTKKKVEVVGLIMAQSKSYLKSVKTSCLKGMARRWSAQNWFCHGNRWESSTLVMG